MDDLVTGDRGSLEEVRSPIVGDEVSRTPILGSKAVSSEEDVHIALLSSHGAFELLLRIPYCERSICISLFIFIEHDACERQLYFPRLFKSPFENMALRKYQLGKPPAHPPPKMMQRKAISYSLPDPQF